MPESARWSIRLGSHQQLTCKPLSPNTSIPTTISSRNARSNTSHPFKPLKTGTPKPELFKKRVYNQPGLDTYMLWASLSYVYNQSLGGLNAAWIGIAVLAFGVLLLLVMHRFPARFDQPAVSSK